MRLCPGTNVHFSMVVNCGACSRRMAHNGSADNSFKMSRGARITSNYSGHPTDKVPMLTSTGLSDFPFLLKQVWSYATFTRSQQDLEVRVRTSPANNIREESGTEWNFHLQHIQIVLSSWDVVSAWSACSCLSKKFLEHFLCRIDIHRQY